MISKILINLFVAAIEILVIFEMAKRFRVNNKTNYIISCVSLIVYMIFSVVATLYIDNSIIMLTVNIIIMFCFTFIYEIKFYKRIMSVLVSLAISVAYELLVMLIVGAVNNITPELIQQDMGVYLLSCIIGKFLLYCTIKAMILLVKPNDKTVGILYNSLTLLMPLATVAILIILSYVVYNFNDLVPKILVLVSAVLLISANIGTFIIYDAISKRENKIRKQLIDIVVLEGEKNEFSSLIDSQIESNKELHDLKHKMHTIKEYINNNDMKVNEIIDEICATSLAKQIVDYMGKVDINALLNAKINSAKSKGINFKINTLILDEIFISSMDLCIILGNMIDNSIEACDQLVEKNLIISLELKTQANYLAIICTNPTNNKNVNIGSSTKIKNTMMHGYGLSKIEDLTLKYDGTMSFGVSSGQFVMSLLLVNSISHP